MSPRCSLRRIWLGSFGIHRHVSSASCFIERSAKLFEEVTSRCPIGKAPPRILLIVPNNPATVSRLKASRFMKTYDLPVQFNFQSGLRNGKLDDVRKVALVDQLFATTGLSHSHVAPQCDTPTNIAPVPLPQKRLLRQITPGICFCSRIGGLSLDAQSMRDAPLSSGSTRLAKSVSARTGAVR
jgi:hypothetical protein